MGILSIYIPYTLSLYICVYPLYMCVGGRDWYSSQSDTGDTAQSGRSRGSTVREAFLDKQLFPGQVHTVLVHTVIHTYIHTYSADTYIHTVLIHTYIHTVVIHTYIPT